MTKILDAVSWDTFLKEMYPLPPHTPEQLARFAEQRAAREAEWRGPLVDVPDHLDNTGLMCRNARRAVPVSYLDHDACGFCNDGVDTFHRRPMRTQEQRAAFERYSDYKTRPYHVHDVTEDHLSLIGGGDFYDGDNTVPDEATQAEARKIAAECGMEITDGRGTWEGRSEYTPDPGDVSVFDWRPVA